MCRQSGKASSEPPDVVPQTGTYNLYWQYTSWKKKRTLCLGMKALCHFCSGCPKEPRDTTDTGGDDDTFIYSHC